jgi:hypothetical protein
MGDAPRSNTGSACDTRIASLEMNRIKDAARIRLLEKWVETVSSPLHKRVWFVAQGYRFRRLGVWYRARWNADGWGY